jgi:hypothetical protein
LQVLISDLNRHLDLLYLCPRVLCDLETNGKSPTTFVHTSGVERDRDELKIIFFPFSLIYYFSFLIPEGIAHFHA